MNDKLNIRELYNNTIREQASLNGNIIMEEVKISADKSRPDRLFFDNGVYAYNNNTRPFCFIGDDSNLIGYVDSSGGTHPYIFNAFALLTTSLGLAECPPMLQMAAMKYQGATIEQAGDVLDWADVGFLGEMDEVRLKYFMDEQKKGDVDITRINTRAGRIWKTITSKALNREISVLMFWCREGQVREDDLKSLKVNFKLGDFFWAGTDSANFNFYADSYREVGGRQIKELRSKISPKLTHEEIVDILMRAHSGFNLSSRDQTIVREFRGHDPQEMKFITGGYDMPAQ